MSVIYGEGLDRVKVGKITTGSLVGKSCDVLVASPGNNTAEIVELSGRRYLTTTPTQVMTDANTTHYVQLRGSSAVMGEANRTSPFLPSWTGAKKIIIGWQMRFHGQEPMATTLYLAGTGVPASEVRINMAPHVNKKAVYFEIIHDLVTLTAQVFADGVVVSNLINVAVGTWKINLSGFYITGSIAGKVYITDLYVVYDDGIAPINRLGPVVIRELVLDPAPTEDPGVTHVQGVDVTTTDLQSTVTGTKLTGGDVKESYHARPNQLHLGNGPVYGIITDVGRGHTSGAPTDLENSLTVGVTNVKLLDNPKSSVLPGYKSIYRGFSEPATLGRVIAETRLDLSAKSR